MIWTFWQAAHTPLPSHVHAMRRQCHSEHFLHKWYLSLAYVASCLTFNVANNQKTGTAPAMVCHGTWFRVSRETQTLPEVFVLHASNKHKTASVPAMISRGAWFRATRDMPALPQVFMLHVPNNQKAATVPAMTSHGTWFKVSRETQALACMVGVCRSFPRHSCAESGIRVQIFHHLKNSFQNTARKCIFPRHKIHLSQPFSQVY